MARATSNRQKLITSIIAWAAAIVIFFPILWIIVLSFKSEGDAISTPLTIMIMA